MAIEKVDMVPILDGEPVKMTEMGFVTELLYMRLWNDGPRIRKLDKDHYVCLDDFGNPVGRIKEFNHFENRANSVNSLRQTFRKLRNLINANVLNIDNVRFLTLTYRQEHGEPMNDATRVYHDFHDFNKRLKRHCINQDFGSYEYINVVEPQGSGAWHCHVLLFFEKKAPYLANEFVRNLWGHGWITIRALKNQLGKSCTNVGAYLTAYLGDLDFQGAVDAKMDITRFQLKEAEITSSDGLLTEKKYYLKGARLFLYPPGMNIFRCSRGAIRPQETYLTYAEGMQQVSKSKLTYQTNIKITADGRTNLLSKRYYNSAERNDQELIAGYRVDPLTGAILERVEGDYSEESVLFCLNGPQFVEHPSDDVFLSGL